MIEEKGKAPEDTEQKSRRPGGPQPDPNIEFKELNLPNAAMTTKEDEFLLPDALLKPEKPPLLNQIKLQLMTVERARKMTVGAKVNMRHFALQCGAHPQHN